MYRTKYNSHRGILLIIQLHMTYYAVNWCVSRLNGRDTMDVIFFFISRPGGLTREKE